MGSRHASPRALRNVSYVARAAIDHGFTIVSGLATGIDTQAHQSALDNGGRTVAVMGTGLDRTYCLSL